MQQTPTPERASRLWPAASFCGFVTGFLRGRDMRHGAQTPPQGSHGPVLSQARGHVGNVVHEWQYDPLLLATRLDLMRKIHQAYVDVGGCVDGCVWVCPYMHSQMYMDIFVWTYTCASTTRTRSHSVTRGCPRPPLLWIAVMGPQACSAAAPLRARCWQT